MRPGTPTAGLWPVEARREREPAFVTDFLTGQRCQVRRDRRDAVAADAHVGVKRRATRTVIHIDVAQQHVCGLCGGRAQRTDEGRDPMPDCHAVLPLVVNVESTGTPRRVAMSPGLAPG